MSPADFVRRIVLYDLLNIGKKSENGNSRRKFSPEKPETHASPRFPYVDLSDCKHRREGEDGSANALEQARNHSFSLNSVQKYLGVVSIMFRLCFKFKSFSLKNKIIQNFYIIISKKEAGDAPGKIPGSAEVRNIGRAGRDRRREKKNRKTVARTPMYYIRYAAEGFRSGRESPGRRAGKFRTGGQNSREQIETALFRNDPVHRPARQNFIQSAAHF